MATRTRSDFSPRQPGGRSRASHRAIVGTQTTADLGHTLERLSHWLAAH